MEKSDREKKLEAGKQKLAAFQKKRRKKKSVKYDDDRPITLTDYSSDSFSVTDSEVQSLTSGDEDSSTEAVPNRDLISTFTELRKANDKIAQLEETVLGKQAALHEVTEENYHLKAELHALSEQKQRATVSSSDEIGSGDFTNMAALVDCTMETEALSHQVKVLQDQLAQSVKVIRSHVEHQQFSAQALHDAKHTMLKLRRRIDDKERQINQLKNIVSSKKLPENIDQSGYPEVENSDLDEPDNSGYVSLLAHRKEMERIRVEMERVCQDKESAEILSREENDHLRRELVYMSRENRELSDRVAELSLVEDKSKLGEEIETLKENLDFKNAEYEKLDTLMNKQLLDNVTYYEDIIEKCKSEAEAIKISLAIKNDEIESLNEENCRLNSIIDDLSSIKMKSLSPGVDKTDTGNHVRNVLRDDYNGLYDKLCDLINCLPHSDEYLGENVNDAMEHVRNECLRLCEFKDSTISQLIRSESNTEINNGETISVENHILTETEVLKSFHYDQKQLVNSTCDTDEVLHRAANSEISLNGLPADEILPCSSQDPEDHQKVALTKNPPEAQKPYISGIEKVNLAYEGKIVSLSEERDRLQEKIVELEKNLDDVGKLRHNVISMQVNEDYHLKLLDNTHEGDSSAGKIDSYGLKCDEVNPLQLQLMTLQSQFNDLVEDYDKVGMERDTFKRELDELVNVKCDLLQQLASSTSKVGAVENENGILLTENCRLKICEEEMQTAMSQMFHLNGQINDLIDNLGILKGENDKLHFDIALKDQQASRSGDEYSELCSKHNLLKKQLDEQISQNQSLELNNIKLTQDCNQMQSELDRANHQKDVVADKYEELKSVEAELCSYRAQNDQLLASLSEASKEKASLELDICDLKKSLEEKKLFESQLLIAREENSSLLAKVSEFDVLQQKCKNLKKLEGQLSQYKDTNKGLVSAVEEIRVKNKEVLIELENLQADYDSLSLDYEDQKILFSDVNEGNDVLIEKVEKYEEEIEKKQNDLDKMAGIVDGLKTELQDLKGTNVKYQDLEDLNQKLREQLTFFDKLQEENTVLIETCGNLKVALGESNKTLQHKENEMLAQYATLEAEYQECSDARNDLAQRCSSLECVMSDYNGKLEEASALQTRLEASLTESRIKCESLEEDLVRCNKPLHDMDELREKCTRLEGELSHKQDLMSKCDNLELEMMKSYEKIKEYEELAITCRQMESDLNIAVVEKTEIAAKYEALKIENSSVMLRDIDDLHTTVTGLMADLDCAMKEKSLLKSKCDSLEDEITQCNIKLQDMDELMVKCVNLEGDLSMVNKEAQGKQEFMLRCQQLERDLVESGEKLQYYVKVEEKCSELQLELDSTKSELVGKSLHCDSLNADLIRLNETLRDFESVTFDSKERIKSLDDQCEIFQKELTIAKSNLIDQEQLASECSRLNELMTSSRDVNAQLQTQLVASSEDLKEVYLKCDGLEKELEISMERLEELSNLKKKSLDLELCLQECNEQITEKDIEIDTLSGKLRHKDDESRSCELLIKELEDANFYICNENTELKQVLEGLKMKGSDDEMALEELRKRVEAVLEEKDKLEKELIEVKDAKNQDCVVWDTRLAECDTKLKNVCYDKEILQHKLEKLDKDWEETYDKLSVEKTGVDLALCECKRDLSNCEDQLSQSEGHNCKLNQECFDLKQSISKFEEEIKNLIEGKKFQAESLSRIEQEKDDIITANVQLQHEVDKTSNEVKANKVLIESYQKQEIEFKVKLDELVSEKEGLRDEIGKLNDMISYFTKDKELMETQAEKLLEKVNLVTEQREASVENYEKEIRILNKEADEQREKMILLEEEHEKSVRNYEEKIKNQNTEADQKLEEMKLLKEEHEMSAKNYEERILNLKREAEEQQKKMKLFEEEHEASVRNYKDNILSLNKEADEQREAMRLHKDEHEKSARNYGEKIVMLTKEVEEQCQKVKLLEQTNEECARNYDEVLHLNTESDEHVITLTTDLHQCKEKILNLQKDVDVKTGLIVDMENKIFDHDKQQEYLQELEVRLVSVQDELRARDEIIKTLNSQLKEKSLLSDEICGNKIEFEKKLKTIEEDNQIEVQSLEKELVRVTLLLNEVRPQKDQLMEQIESITVMNDGLTADIVALETQVSDKNSELQALYSKMENMRTIADGLSTQNEHLKKEVEEVKTAAQGEGVRLNSDKEQLVILIQDKERKEKDLSDKLKEKSTMVEDLHNQNRVLCERHQEIEFNVQKMSEVHSLLEAEKQALVFDLSLKSQSLSESLVERDELLLQVKNLTESLDASSTELQHMQETLDIAQVSNAQLRETIKRNEEITDHQRMQLDTWEQENLSLKDKLSVVNTKLDTAIIDIDYWQSQHRILDDQIAELDATNKKEMARMSGDFEVKLNKFQRQMQCLKVTNNELEEKIKSTEGRHSELDSSYRNVVSANIKLTEEIGTIEALRYELQVKLDNSDDLGVKLRNELEEANVQNIELKEQLDKNEVARIEIESKCLEQADEIEKLKVYKVAVMPGLERVGDSEGGGFQNDVSSLLDEVSTMLHESEEMKDLSSLYTNRRQSEWNTSDMEVLLGDSCVKDISVDGSVVEERQKSPDDLLIELQELRTSVCTLQRHFLDIGKNIVKVNDELDKRDENGTQDLDETFEQRLSDIDKKKEYFAKHAIGVQNRLINLQETAKNIIVNSDKDGLEFEKVTSQSSDLSSNVASCEMIGDVEEFRREQEEKFQLRLDAERELMDEKKAIELHQLKLVMSAKLENQVENVERELHEQYTYKFKSMVSEQELKFVRELQKVKNELTREYNAKMAVHGVHESPLPLDEEELMQETRGILPQAETLRKMYHEGDVQGFFKESCGSDASSDSDAVRTPRNTRDFSAFHPEPEEQTQSNSDFIHDPTITADNFVPEDVKFEKEHEFPIDSFVSETLVYSVCTQTDKYPLKVEYTQCSPEILFQENEQLKVKLADQLKIFSLEHSELLKRYSDMKIELENMKLLHTNLEEELSKCVDSKGTDHQPLLQQSSPRPPAIVNSLVEKEIQSMRDEVAIQNEKQMQIPQSDITLMAETHHDPCHSSQIFDNGKFPQLNYASGKIPSETAGKSHVVTSHHADSLALTSVTDTSHVYDDDTELAELSKLRREIQETRALYARENAFLQETLDRDSADISRRMSLESIPQSQTNSSQSVTPLKLPISLEGIGNRVKALERANKDLTDENQRLLNLLQEQENLVRRANKSYEGKTLEEAYIGDCQNAYGEQITMLQSQRNDLQRKLSEKSVQESTLLQVLGDKAILEEDLRREKSILADKIFQKGIMDIDYAKLKTDLERSIQETRRLEEQLRLRDEAQCELMRQKRLLEEGLSEIEGRLHEREAQLELEKVELLKELNDKDVQLKQLEGYRYGSMESIASASLSIGSGSVISQEDSDSKIRALRKSMDKRHKQAIEVLRMQLEAEHMARELRIREQHQRDVAQLKTHHKQQLGNAKLDYAERLLMLAKDLRPEVTSGFTMVDHHPAAYGDTLILNDIKSTIQPDVHEKLEHLLSDIHRHYRVEIEKIQQSHREEVHLHVDAMRVSLEQVYNAQYEILKAECERQYLSNMAAKQEEMNEEYKNKVATLEASYGKLNGNDGDCDSDGDEETVIMSKKEINYLNKEIQSKDEELMNVNRMIFDLKNRLKKLEHVEDVEDADDTGSGLINGHGAEVDMMNELKRSELQLAKLKEDVAEKDKRIAELLVEVRDFHPASSHVKIENVRSNDSDVSFSCDGDDFVDVDSLGVDELKDMYFAHQFEITQLKSDLSLANQQCDSLACERTKEIETLHSDWENKLTVNNEVMRCDFEAERKRYEVEIEDLKLRLALENVGGTRQEIDERTGDFDRKIRELALEYDERCEKLRLEFEEQQEEEKACMERKHSNEMTDLKSELDAVKDQFNRLIEALDNGDWESPALASYKDSLKEKMDLELEMARTLLQQEYDDHNTDLEQYSSDEMASLKADLEEKLRSEHESQLENMMCAMEKEQQTVLKKLTEKYQREIDRLQLQLDDKLDKSIISEAESLQTADDADDVSDPDLGSTLRFDVSHELSHLCDLPLRTDYEASDSSDGENEALAAYASLHFGDDKAGDTEHSKDEREGRYGTDDTDARVVNVSLQMAAADGKQDQDREEERNLESVIVASVDEQDGSKYEEDIFEDDDESEASGEEGGYDLENAQTTLADEIQRNVDISDIIADTTNGESANQHLLSVLSDSIKIYLSLEDDINQCLTKMVTKENSVAEADLDISRKISATKCLFEGPHLKKADEELVKEVGARLQTSVSHLMELAQTTNEQLHRVSWTQGELLDTMIMRSHDSDDLVSERDDRVKELMTTKEYLALELHKAEGLIEGYVCEQRTQQSHITDLEEREQSLIMDLDRLQSRLHELEISENEVESLKDELQQQKILLAQETSAENRETTDQAVGTEPISDDGLLLEINRLNDEKRDLLHRLQKEQDDAQNQLRQAEVLVEELQQINEALSEDRKVEISELEQQIEVLEKQLKTNRQFLDEQAVDRERERDEAEREISRLQRLLTEKEKRADAHTQLKQEVEELNEALQSREVKHRESLNANEILERELARKKEVIHDLRVRQQSLENELEEKGRKITTLSQKLSSATEQLGKNREMEEVPESDRSTMQELQNVIAELEGRLDAKEHQLNQTQIAMDTELKRASECEEELLQNKEVLQARVYDLLNQVSSLKIQLDQVKHRADSEITAEVTRLQNEIESERETISSKEQEVSNLEEQLKLLQSSIHEKDENIEQLTLQLQLANQQLTYLQREQTDSIKDIIAENNLLKDEVKRLGEAVETSLPQSLVDEKNAEIEELTLKLRNRADCDTQRGEALTQKQIEIDELKSKLDTFQSQEHLMDTTVSDDRIPVLFTTPDKASLQDEMRDSLVEKSATIEQLERRLQTMQDEMRDSLVEKSATIEQLEQRLKAMQDENDELLSTSSERATMISDLREELATNQVTIHELTARTVQLQSEVDDLTESQVKCQNTITDLQSQVAVKDRRLEEKDEELYFIQEKLETVEGSNRELKSYRDVVAEKDLLVAELTQTVETDRDAMNRQREELKILKDEVAHLKGQLDDKAKELQIHEVEVSRLEAIVDEREMEIEKLGEENKLSSTAETHLRRELQGVKETLEDREKHIRKLTRAMAEQHSNEQDRDIQMKVLQSELMETKASLFACQQESSQYKENLEKLQAQLLDVSAAKDAQISLLEAETSNLRNQLSDVERPPQDGGDTSPGDDGKSKTQQLDQELQQNRALLEEMRQNSVSVSDLQKQLGDLRDQLTSEYETDIRFYEERAARVLEDRLAEQARANVIIIDRLKEQHQRELKKLEESHREALQGAIAQAPQDASDNPTVRIGEKLLEEVATNRAIDERLFSKLNQEQLTMAGEATPNESSLNGTSNLDFTLSNDEISEQLRTILRQMHEHGVEILSYSQLKFLQEHASPQRQRDNVDLAALQSRLEDEREAYLAAVRALRDVNNLCQKIADVDGSQESEFARSDWRRELIQAVGEAFVRERDITLSQLHTQALYSNDEERLHSMEMQIREQSVDQQKSLERLFEADRQTLLSEIRHLKTRLAHVQVARDEEKNLASRRIGNAEDQVVKKERQLNRKVEMLESKLKQEAILLDDAKCSLDIEKARSCDLSRELAKERNHGYDMQMELTARETQINKLRDSILREQEKYKAIITTLEEERAKSRQFSDALDEQKVDNQRLRGAIEDEQLHASQANTKSHQLLQSIQRDLEKEQARSSSLTKNLAQEHLSVENLRKKIHSVEESRRSTEEQLRQKLTEIQTDIERERARSRELQSGLSHERGISDQLYKSLEERDRQASDQNQTQINELLSLLENEKRGSRELERLLRLEQEHVLALQQAAQSEKLRGQHDLDDEKERVEGLKKELATIQMQNLELIHQSEVSKHETSRIQINNEHLRSEIESLRGVIKDAENRREYQRVESKKKMRDLKKLCDDGNLKLLGKDVEIQQLRQKMEDSVAELKKLEDWSHDHQSQELQSLQTALTQSKARVAQLEAQILVHHETQSRLNRSTQAIQSENDDKKIQRLYGRYLRAESFRKSLIYQKKYLLLLLGGFRAGERETLTMIASLGCYPAPDVALGYQSASPMFTKFRTGVRCVIAIQRMKYLSRKWRRAVDVGVPVMTSNVLLNKGYLSTGMILSPPRPSLSPTPRSPMLRHQSDYQTPLPDRSRPHTDPSKPHADQSRLRNSIQSNIDVLSPRRHHSRTTDVSMNDHRAVTINGKSPSFDQPVPQFHRNFQNQSTPGSDSKTYTSLTSEQRATRTKHENLALSQNITSQTHSARLSNQTSEYRCRFNDGDRAIDGPSVQNVNIHSVPSSNPLSIYPSSLPNDVMFAVTIPSLKPTTSRSDSQTNVQENEINAPETNVSHRTPPTRDLPRRVVSDITDNASVSRHRVPGQYDLHSRRGHGDLFPRSGQGDTSPHPSARSDYLTRLQSLQDKLEGLSTRSDFPDPRT